MTSQALATTLTPENAGFLLIKNFATQNSITALVATCKDKAVLASNHRTGLINLGFTEDDFRSFSNYVKTMSNNRYKVVGDWEKVNNLFALKASVKPV